MLLCEPYLTTKKGLEICGSGLGLGRDFAQSEHVASLFFVRPHFFPLSLSLGLARGWPKERELWKAVRKLRTRFYLNESMSQEKHPKIKPPETSPDPYLTSCMQVQKSFTGWIFFYAYFLPWHDSPIHSSFLTQMDSQRAKKAIQPSPRFSKPDQRGIK